jgi:hypothetical protein
VQSDGPLTKKERTGNNQQTFVAVNATLSKSRIPLNGSSSTGSLTNTTASHRSANVTPTKASAVFAAIQASGASGLAGGSDAAIAGVTKNLLLAFGL